MEEYLDVLDENGYKTGEIFTRKKIHELGLWHKIIVVSIIDKNGNLLMQQRSYSKEKNPGEWDTSVAGHVSSGQTSIEAAIREISEELGIQLLETDLQYLFTYKDDITVNKNYLDKQIYDCYIVNLDSIDINSIKIQESEVHSVKLCDVDEFKRIVSSNNIVDRPELFEKLINYINKK